METKTYQTAKEFFKYLNNYEADIWIRGSKAYNVNGELIAEYNVSAIMINTNETSKNVNNSALHKTNVIGRLFCKIGIHNWEEGFSGNLFSPCAEKCKRCRIVRVFNGWGYIYGRDANDL